MVSVKEIYENQRFRARRKHTVTAVTQVKAGKYRYIDVCITGYYGVIYMM